MDSVKKMLTGLVMIAAGVFYVTHAHGAAPLGNAPAPGCFRMPLGDFESTARSDGTVPLSMEKLLTSTSPMRVDELLKRSFLANPVGMGHLRVDRFGDVFVPANYSVRR